MLTVDVLLDNDLVGHRRIQKWQRVIGDVIQVKNDYVLIHVEPETNKTILYDKRWRAIDIDVAALEIKPFKPPRGEYFWKKLVLFVDEDDLGFFEDGSSFYTFFEADEYPLLC